MFLLQGILCSAREGRRAAEQRTAEVEAGRERLQQRRQQLAGEQQRYTALVAKLHRAAHSQSDK